MRSYKYVCMHACMYLFLNPPSIDIGLAGYAPLQILKKKLPTPMIYIGHVQIGAIIVVMHGLLDVYRGGGGIRVGYSTYHICLV